MSVLLTMIVLSAKPAKTSTVWIHVSPLSVDHGHCARWNTIHQFVIVLRVYRVMPMYLALRWVVARMTTVDNRKSVIICQAIGKEKNVSHFV